jgi:hypothetical protein
MKHQHRRSLLTVTSLASVGLLTGCGGSGSPSGGAVTVTVTPTVTATGGPSASTPQVPVSDDVGRAFDYGAVVSAKTVAGVTVIELDRYTWKGLDDAKLARQGIPAAPFKGALPYENLNTKLTYTLPVADGARVLYHHCVAFGQPLQTKSAPLKDFMSLGDPEKTVVVSLDSQGRITAAENIPGCTA